MDHACLLVRLRPIVAFQDGLALVRERSSVQHPLMTDRKPFHALMTEVCVERGWCGSVVDDRSMHVTDFLPDRGMMTVDQFVGWVFEADGVDPSEDLQNGKSTSTGFATRSYATWAVAPSMSNV